MRGRRGQLSSSSSSSSVSQEQPRMARRKQVLKDASDIPTGSQQIDENSQEDEALDNQDETDELSLSLLTSTREKRKKERANKSKPKEMTEEEMMDLALRLSEQEASVTALRLQQEEEAMMKAIQESMVSQTQLCPQNLLVDAEASLRINSRRKLLYSSGKTSSVVDQGTSDDVCTPDIDLDRGAKRTGDESNDRNKKRKRKEGSPLLEMPDLSQTQKIYSQASPCSSECVLVPPDSPQSCDSTQIDDCQLRKSPVFPSAGCKAEVLIPRLNPDLLDTCKTLGFVLCSQDSLTTSQKSPPAQPKSPTFPKSPKCSSNHTLSKSPVFSETDQGDDGETQLSPEYFKSPVFGKNTQHEKSSSACKAQDSVCNSGFMFSSQESLTPSVRSTSCRPKSPVFPRSTGNCKNLPLSEKSATCNSPVLSETDVEQTEQSSDRCTSPVFDGTPQQQQKNHLDEQQHCVSPSACLGSASKGNSTTTSDSSQSLRQDSKTAHNQDVGFTKSSQSDGAEEPNEEHKYTNSAEMELTSDMTLHWSEDDDDVTPVGSPSPVFPEERPVHRAESQAASLNHVTAASPGTNCRPSSSSMSAPSGEPAGGSTVHYYWGVPFCPQGLDPDKYTQVILAQMEVYEKSLKQAQRCLLRKAEWGEAVMPQQEKSPSPESPAEESQLLIPRRRGLKLRGRKLCDAADSPAAEAEEEEEEEDKKDGEEVEERESKEEEQKEEEKRGEGQVDTDDCEVCPETQLSDNDDDRTQDLMIDTDTGAKLGFQTDCKKSPELPEVEMILQDDSPAGNQLQEEEEMEVEVDAPEDRKMKGNIPISSSDAGEQHAREEEVEEEDLDVEEIKDRVLPRSTSPELEPATVPQSPETKVDCPICQGSFPVTEIEMHAAYCDGEVAVVDERRPENNCFQASLKPRRKRTRRAEATAEETEEPPNTGKNPEKCYVCQKAVPLREYSRHTELCIQRRASKTAARGNLLTALEQTESRDSEAGPSGSKLQPGDVIDLRDDDDDEEEDKTEEGGVSAFRISNSPIRSFTPISEATDCLIDFKKQQRVKKLRQRRR